MKQDILAEVIEAEREIVRALDQEKAKIQEWLEQNRKKAAADADRAEEDLRASYEQALADADREAEKNAQAIVKEADERAARVRGLDEEELKRIVGKHIHKVLSG